MRRFSLDTYFARLFLLFFIALTASHFLGTALVSSFEEAPRIKQHHPLWWLYLTVRIVVLVVTAWVAARWLSRPMQRLAGAAQSLGDTLERVPVETGGPAEARQAAEVFNRMQARIKEQVEERSRFLAAVSHDLRTPLTRMRLRLERVDAPELRSQLQAEVGEMAAMLDAVLDYLRGQAQGEPRRLFDVTALAQTVAEDAQELGQAVTVSGAAAPLPAQPGALRRCLSNLVENAVRYGGSAEITLHDAPGSLRIEVRDHGPGIPSERMEAVFAPFQRLDDSRNRATGGVGLGLAIARDIARRHGGEVTLANADGGGLVAALVLPRSAI